MWEVKIFALDGESVQRLITLPTSGVNYLSGITTFGPFPVRPDGAFICSIFGRVPQAKFVLGTAKIPNTKEFLKNDLPTYLPTYLHFLLQINIF